MKTKILSENELYQKAFELLLDNLGSTETFRFLEAVEKRKIDSVKRHRKWQKGLDKDVFFREVYK